MASLNRVYLIGNLTRDPEIRYLPSGKAVADIQLAVSRRYKLPSGEFKEDPCFVGIVAWERQAELAGEYLKKGSSILVEGSLRYRQWESNAGEKRSRLEVNADRIQFLDRLKKTTGTAEPAGDRNERPAAAEPEPAEQEPPASGADAKTDEDNLPF